MNNNMNCYGGPTGSKKVLNKFLFFLIIINTINTAIAVEPLTVSGNRILAGNQEASFAGPSLFWSNNNWGGEKFYNEKAVRWLKTDWNASLVRASMGIEDEGGYFDDPVSNLAKIRVVVEAAIANDMYVIIDWHSHHAHEHDWGAAIGFFQQMARDYGHHPNIIYEIYNEPLQIPWEAIKPYAEAVINAIRQIDSDNLIIVGTPQWSQRVDEASRDPINRSNIAYALHFYAGTHFDQNKHWAQEALNNGAALFVTEWGTVNANGDGNVNDENTDSWMAFLKANNLSHANWALNDKVEGASALYPGASAYGDWDTLTASGIKAKEIIKAWPSPGHPGNCKQRISIPAKIEAEQYCDSEGIQVEVTSDIGGGLNVGYIDTGDWMKYNVNVPETGIYTVSYRVAALDGGTLQLENSGGNPIYGSLAIPATHDWQNWITITHTVYLPAGDQSIALSAPTGGWNINWFTIDRHHCLGNKHDSVE